MRGRSIGVMAVSAVVAVVAAGLALAQREAGQPVLHQDLPAPASDPSGVVGPSGPDQNPAAITAGDKVLSEPQVNQPIGQGEPVYGQGGVVADRQTEMRPDLNTGADGTLHYTSVFNPDPIPFKRMTALDQVRDDYTLGVERTGTVDVPVGGVSDASRDRFWGELAVRLEPGREVAIPSVAPDMRILSVETEPAVRLTFSKDGADNFFVRADDNSSAGTVRLVFLVDADADYFAPSWPSRRYTLGEIGRLAPPELRTTAPPGVIRAAARTLDRIGIDADTELRVGFDKLVGYFRAFEAGASPPTTGDIYRDLTDNQIGVCRHRAFAFAVTATALGLPTRMVYNEAHAFVEVWLPERGWTRVDLGGAALRLEVTGGEDKTLHRPRQEDPFAKPREYSNGYTQMRGDIGGLSQGQLDDRHAPLDEAPPSGTVADDPNADPNAAPDPGGALIGPGPGLPTRSADPAKSTPTLRVTRADPSVFRGEALVVEGMAEVDGRALIDHPIEIFVAPAGGDGADAVLIGRAVTDQTGAFSLTAQVPRELNLVAYEAFLSTQEDAQYNAALSQ